MCVLLIVSVIPFTHNTWADDAATSQIADSHPGLGRAFRTCYIEATGLLNGQWKIMYLKPFNNEYAIVYVWKLFLGDDADINIYDRENGRLLYEHHGSRALLLMGFRGDYFHPTAEYYGITIQGKALVVRPSLYIP